MDNFISNDEIEVIVANKVKQFLNENQDNHLSDFRIELNYDYESNLNSMTLDIEFNT